MKWVDKSLSILFDGGGEGVSFLHFGFYIYFVYTESPRITKIFIVLNGKHA